MARVFFSLPSSDGFLLAGGAALLAQHLTHRSTSDLDFFASPAKGSVPDAREAFERAATEHGWTTTRIHDAESFCRIIVHGAEDLVVDLALDASPQRQATVTVLGPSYDAEELIGRKMVALFDRAEARDFVDVYQLAQRDDRPTLLARAEDIDPGFDTNIFAQMLGMLDRFTDAELPCASADAPDIRTFFADWRRELSS